MHRFCPRLSANLRSRGQPYASMWIGVMLIGLSAPLFSQPFPESSSAQAASSSSPQPPRPQKIVIRGAADEELPGTGEIEEREEDESMVFRRMEHEQRRRRLSPDEEQQGHARVRVHSFDRIRRSHPTPRLLPQLATSKHAPAFPLIGPPSDSSQRAITPAGQIFGSRWVDLGPRAVYNGQPAGGARCKVSGRISAAAFDPSDTTYKTIYIGGADGGIWKTTNHGTTWTPLTDAQPTLATGCITVNAAASNEVYVGTGEPVLSNDTKTGAGILISTDAGNSWISRQSAALANTRVAQLAIDRATSTGPTRRIIAATHAGIYLTEDTFQSISLVQSGRFHSVIQDLNNAQVWWATRTSSVAGSSGLYKSINNGITWTQQSTGIPTTLPGVVGLADMVQAPSNPNIMYAIFNGQADYSRLNIYKTTNGGTNWNQIDNSYTASAGSGQFFYNVYVAVNPVNANEIYISGSSPLYRSTNGGGSFTNVGTNFSLHPDHQFGMFRPDGARFYDCNDGGIYYTDNPGGSDWISLNDGLGLLQVNSYALALHPTQLEVLAGTQDNGTCRYLGTSTWNLVNLGDGGFTLWDSTDSRYVYNGYISRTLFRSDIGGYGWTNITPGTSSFPDNQYSFPFYPKAALNPGNPNMLVLGCDSLLRNSVARTGATWTAASGKLQGADTQISAIAFAPSNQEVCYIAFENGSVYRSGNISATSPAWSLIMTHPNSSFCSDLAVDPTNANQVIAVFYRFTNAQVYEITNTNTTPVANNRSAGFPAMAANCVQIDSTNVGVWYVGTEFGVYRSTDAGSSWENFSTGMPNSAVDDLALDNARSILLAGTHGRGVWMVARPEIKLTSVTIQDNGIGGNGNGSIDQNERINLTVLLANSGSEDATAISTSLSSFTPNVSIMQGAAVYSNLTCGGGAQTNNTAFSITTGDAIPAGKQIDLLLTLSSNGGNYVTAIPITLRAGVATTLMDFSEGFESGFGGFTQANASGAGYSWSVDTSKPFTGTRCAHFEEPYPYEYQLDDLRSPVYNFPAGANCISVSLDQTNNCVQYGLAGGRVLLTRNGGGEMDLTSATAGILKISKGYTGKFDSTYMDPACKGQQGFVNGGPGLPYSTTTLELDPSVWAGKSLQVIFRYNWNGFPEKLNGPTGWFIDNFRVRADNFSIQALAAANEWQLLR